MCLIRDPPLREVREQCLGHRLPHPRHPPHCPPSSRCLFPSSHPIVPPTLPLSTMCALSSPHMAFAPAAATAGGGVCATPAAVSGGRPPPAARLGRSPFAGAVRLSRSALPHPRRTFPAGAGGLVALGGGSDGGPPPSPPPLGGIPSSLLLLTSSVAAIASIGCVFELSSVRWAADASVRVARGLHAATVCL